MIRLTSRPGRAGSRYLALVALAQVFVAEGALGSDGTGVAWRPDLASAQAEAKGRNLPLWIQFTGPWCVNCRRMDRGTFSSPPVVAVARDRFVPVKLRSDEYEQLALNLGLSVLPSTVIVKPTGDVIDKWEGFGEPGEFLVFLEETLARFDKEKDGRVELALASYCPVSLVEQHKLVPGRTTLTARRDGFEYRFADDAARRAFLASPEKYAPANRGESPVSHVEQGVFRPGDPKFGVLYRGHLYLCADGAERERFLRNPERYANVDLAVRQTCPHCWGERTNGQLAVSPGRPAPSTATRRPAMAAGSVVLEALISPVSRLLR
jgi:YHS domain-containing protein